MTTSTFLVTDALIKATVLLVLVALAATLLRRASASLRHLLWTLAIAGIIAIPVITALVPYRLRVLPTTIASPQFDQRDAKSSVSSALPTAERPALLGSAPLVADPLGTQRTSTESPATPKTPVSLTMILVGIWLAGMAIVLARFAVGVVIVRRVVRGASIVTDTAWRSLADRAARLLGVRSAIEVRRSDDVAMPFACGLLTPTIVLPASSDEWSSEKREAVLMHELAHVSRGDLAMNMFSHVACAAYWFHPLAWLAAYRLRVEGERASDDAVLRAGARPSDYAEHLLSIVRSLGNTVPSAALAMARRSDFEGRLLAILEPGIPRGRMTRWSAAGVAAAFVLAVMPLAAMAPASEAPSTDNSVPDASAREVERSSEVAASVATTSKASFQVTPGAGAPRAPQAQEQLPAAVAALIETLGDASAAVRIAAANSLGALDDPRAIAALAKALREDADPRVREAAAWALGEIDDSRAVPHLLEALKTERVSSVKEKIVRALGEIDDPTAVAGIGAVLKDPSVAVRRAAVWALGELEDASAVAALIGMVRDEDAEVRKHVAESLGQLENTSAIDALATLTRDTNADVRVHAVSALGQLDDERTMPALVAALKDSNADVRAHAADALGDIDNLERAPGALIEALSDPNREVRKSAANALGSIEDEAAVPALKRLTSDGDTEVRREAAEALSDIGGPEAIAALMGMLKDPDPEIRRIVAEALGSKRR